jgi:hypothetical protein
MHFLALVAETFCVVLIGVDGLKFCSVRISFVDLECFPVLGVGGFDVRASINDITVGTGSINPPLCFLIPLSI